MSPKTSKSDGLQWVLEHTLFVPVAAIRPYLILKSTLIFMAFDIWLTRLSHGGRYGAGGFNVAHFAWLDAIQPTISPSLHLSVSLVASFLCMILALVNRPPRWLMAILAVVYTWSWTMSMLDSYQHHYLLSIVLFAFVFFPNVGLREVLVGETSDRRQEPKVVVDPAPAKKRKKGKKGKGSRNKAQRAESNVEAAEKVTEKSAAPLPQTSAWAYYLFCIAAAIVYTYTAISKTHDEWLSGAALQRVIANADEPLAPIQDLVATFGITGDTFWWLMGHSVVWLQMVCAAGYLLAPFSDVARGWPLRAFKTVALLGILSFHIGAEHMDLKIGWFSYYMLFYALVTMLPGWFFAPLKWLTTPLKGGSTLPEEKAVSPGDAAPIEETASETTTPPETDYLAVLMLSIGALSLAGAGYVVDLPGAKTAGVLVAAALGLYWVVLLVQGRPTVALRGYGIGAMITAAALVVSISYSDVRWDFYRNVGGDHRRRQEYRTALWAYEQANRYAPEGEDRRRQEQEMRDRIEAEER